ncbi:MAG: exopolyphosphatase [Alphaproteobacteria bacterium]|nr:exopolyphosphatase [Alphaproteobacteria bacterium]MBF0249429.1 exopolyphosphatase [Alphaproteobacteria bacterium]
MSDDKKYRLVTRADFDGVVAGGLLIELGLIDDVLFAEPKAMQDGLVEITSNDITTNLPYVDGVHLCFDHHISETERVGKHDNHVIEAGAPSAARVVYNHFGGKDKFSAIPEDLMVAVDQADSAQYSAEDILAPGPWTLLNFILDPRTGLARFENFEISHEQLMKDMMVYVRHHPVEEILTIPDVEERVHLYMEHEEKFELQLRDCSTVHGKAVVIDLRNEDIIYAGNRFTIYAIYPDCNVSVQMTKTKDGKKVILAVGKSILNRTNTANIGSILLEYGGGGHAAAGTCQIEPGRVDDVLKDILARLA